MRELVAVEKAVAVVGLGNYRKAHQSRREKKGFTEHLFFHLRNEEILLILTRRRRVKN